MAAIKESNRIKLMIGVAVATGSMGLAGLAGPAVVANADPATSTDSSGHTIEWPGGAWSGTTISEGSWPGGAWTERTVDDGWPGGAFKNPDYEKATGGGAYANGGGGGGYANGKAGGAWNHKE